MEETIQEDYASVAKPSMILDRDDVKRACVASVLRTLSYYRRLVSRGARDSVGDKEDAPPDYSVLDRNLEGSLGECAFKKRMNLDKELALFEDVATSEGAKVQRRNRRIAFRDPYDAVLKDGSKVDVKTTTRRFGDGTFEVRGDSVKMPPDHEFRMYARTDQVGPDVYAFFIIDEGQGAYRGTRSWCRDAFRRCVIDEAEEGAKTTRDSCDAALEGSIVLKMNSHFLDRGLRIVEAGWSEPSSIVALKSRGSSRGLFACVAKDMKPFDDLDDRRSEIADLAASLDALKID